MAARPKRYAMVIDSKKCINCKACIVACRAENFVPLAYDRPWINEETRGVWPKLMAVFQPEQCHQCSHPACVRVCPTGAWYRRPDGIVVVNEADCVGCRYCMIACPYKARFFRQEKVQPGGTPELLRMAYGASAECTVRETAPSTRVDYEIQL